MVKKTTKAPAKKAAAKKASAKKALEKKAKVKAAAKAKAPAAKAGRKGKPKLKNISEIRRFFHRNETPIYFISATNFNLLGVDEWVRNFKYIAYIDCFDGRHPSLFSPKEVPHDEFTSIEDINNYLLQHKDVIDYVEGRGGKPKVVFLMFDDKTEKLAKELGWDVWFPKAKLRTRVDNKIETVRIGNKAGVPSVPNTLSVVKDWDHLQKVAAKAKIGSDLVLQSAFGDSGHTTFFIKNEDDFNKHKDEIVGQGEIKIMKRINCRGSAIEACATKAGTIVGPLMTELVGFKELTPYRGGWCGNEIFPKAFPQEVMDKTRDYTFRFGEQLRKEGYRGYFELDFLIDQDTNEVYLGELNPRITGASSMTNHAAFAHADAPLFLFHLLEFSGADFDFDIAELNERWAEPENIDSWCQMVVKHTEDSIGLIAEAPETGIWRMNKDGSVEFDRFDHHRRAVESEAEAFFLRILKPGDYHYEGADLGIIVTRGRAMDKNFNLTERSKAWIDGIRKHFKAKPLAPAAAPQEVLDHRFKIF
ncbi:biotin carboxylase [Methylovirgula sp. 4M-Z18]|uniref:biotin carboxylase n=1 Tax=Methylovirgula sp. 4M-Z18 TaxID=2293567 RepID=UPI000E2F9F0A|nr:biotin carboxylase [Methylovirgula sp. 4M-Z18]RFB79551.1 biotin carboxylase [Methylovirgula sp. 4M-Z18]